MKKIYSLLTALLLVAFAQAQTCSVALSHTLQANGSATIQYSVTAPSGMAGWMIFGYSGGGGQMINIDSSITGSITPQFYSNDTIIVTAQLQMTDPVDSTSCTSWGTDTLIISNYSCLLSVDSIYATNYGGLNQNFGSNYHTSPNNSAVPFWRVEDMLGNIITTYSGQTSFNYTFPTYGDYRVYFVAAGTDANTGQFCGDSSYVDVSLHDTCTLQAHVNAVVGPNGVDVTGTVSGGTFATNHITIAGVMFYNTDSVHYQFPAGGTYQVCYYVEDTLNSGCLSYDCTTITVGTPPPVPCNASFYIYQDSLNPTVWHGVNTSTGPSTMTYFWDFGDGSSSTLPALTHTYANPGNYVICLTVADSATSCTSTHCDSSAAFRLSTSALIGSITITQPSAVGIAAQAMQVSSFNLFPNPMTDLSTIVFNAATAAKGKVEIMDVLGNVTLSETVSIVKGSNTIGLNTSALANGVYYVRVMSENTVLSTIKAIR